MLNPMPLVHHSRRLRRLATIGRLTNEAQLAEVIDRMTRAYLAMPANGWAKALKVEIDRAEMLV